MLREQSSKPSPPAWLLSAEPDPKRGYVALQGHVLLPSDLVDYIGRHGLKVDYDYVKVNGDNVKKWKFDNRSGVTFESWPWERVASMKVLEKLEKT